MKALDHTPATSAPANVDDLPRQLRELFGHAAFRPGQEPVIRAVLEGKSVLALMPTGAGKSLCYQLPALLLPGTTLVISPLIALMKDQVDGLPEAAYGRTTLVNSTLPLDEMERRLAEIAAGKYKLVYAAPERLRQWPFLHALRRAGLSLLVIDEAHCVDLWGHDFRPDYLFIGHAARRLGRPPVLAMTATATAELADLLSERFGHPFTLLSTGVLRPNLRLEVSRQPNEEAKLRALVRLLKQERGAAIVYVNSRERTEEIARILRAEGIQAAAYHAGLDPATRTEVQDAFMLDRRRVVVATVAFGMGVDKANVRLIAHMSPPRSLEAYAQESGRAGRDGRPARCVLFCSPSDRSRLGRWQQEDRLSLETLRAVYRALREVVGSPGRGGSAIGRLPASALVEAGGLEGAVADETVARVALSLLENAGLVRRRLDLPLRVQVEVVAPEPPADVPAGLVEEFGLWPGQRRWLDPLDLAAALDLPPDEAEERLLTWQAAGWLRYRPGERQMLIELPPPPADSRERIEALLQRAAREAAARLDQMFRYANATFCRQRFIAAHFGQRTEECGVCDICRPAEAQDEEAGAARPVGGADPATAIRDCLRSLPFRVGKSGLVKVLSGSIRSPIKADRCAQFGALADQKRGQIERWIDELLADGFLEWEDQGEYRALALTDRWETETPRLERPAPLSPWTLGRQPERRDPNHARPERSATQPPRLAGAAPAADPADGPRRQAAFDGLEPGHAPALDMDLFERLRAWRLTRARQEGLPPYVIFHDRTLAEIALRRPTDAESLARVPGVGPAKLARYADELIELLAAE